MFARATTAWLLARQCRREKKESLPPEMRAMTRSGGVENIIVFGVW